MLVLDGIAKAFGPWRALAGVSLTVAAGEAVLLVGRNGAGKTTLLRIATGFLDPDTGTVTIAGLAMATDRAGAQGKLGYLPEQAPAPHELTVLDHLRLRARLKGIAGPAVTEAVERCMADAEITDQAARPIGTLSKGYRQRVGLADALLGAPPLLLLDEPTSGMDPIQTRQLCERLIAAAKDRGCAVLVSSHAVADLEPLAARVVVLAKGAVIADGTPAELCEKAKKDRLEAAVLELLGGEAAA
ncbi:MAG: ABC transporter ATP-binding protein [Deltaproteobacteria bacterium]|nr:ABC transporter ATP-binding protein [Deltaproteobacteria bacterium]